MDRFSSGTNWSRRSFLRGLGLLSVTAFAGSLLGCRHEGQNDASEGPPRVALGGPKGELAFFPDRLRIKPGDTVTWFLQSSGHTTTAYHPKNQNLYKARIPNGAEPWDSPLMVQKGATFSWTFKTEGVYNYFCRPHESIGMVGVIVVGKPVDGPGLATPQAELPPLARQKLEELVAWAKQLS